MNLFKYLKEKEVYQKNRIFQNLRNCLLNSQSQRRVSDSSRQPNRNAWIFILGTAICVIGCLSYYCCVTNHPRLCAKKNHHYIMFMDSRRSRHQGNGLSLFLDVWGLKWLGSWGERNLFQDCFFLHTSSMLAGMTKRWGASLGLLARVPTHRLMDMGAQRESDCSLGSAVFGGGGRFIEGMSKE